MWIRMLGTHPGSPDGIHIVEYRVGEVYEVPQALGKAFVADLGWAELFSPEPALETLRGIALAAPENTTAARAPEVPERVAKPRKTPSTAQHTPSTPSRRRRS